MMFFYSSDFALLRCLIYDASDVFIDGFLTPQCSCLLQTLYCLRAEIRPADGEQQCRMGTLCGLEVSITRLTEPSEAERDEEEQTTESEGLRTTKLMYEGTYVCETLFFFNVF